MVRRSTIQRSRLLAAVLGVLIAGNTFAQNPANPVYMGMQPDLVRGIDDGLATERPRVRHVYLAAPRIVAVVIDAQAIPLHPIEPFQLRPGDTIRGQGLMKLGASGEVQHPRHRHVIRDGVELGEILGEPPSHLWRPLEFKGDPLDLAWAQAPTSYTLTADGTSATPVAVHRKSAPLMREWIRGGKQASTARHEIYLQFDRPLTPGITYTLVFKGSPLARSEVQFTFDETRLRSEAIHVNLGGYHPEQSSKLATLSMWIGSGGGVSFDEVRRFRVIDDANGRTAFEGDIALMQAASPGKEMPANEKVKETTNDLPMAVYAMDFSGLKAPGTYRVVVPNIGSSFPFRIDRSVWLDAARLSAHGYLNQRSGLALGPPHTKFVRPRDMHPDDGFKVRLTDPTVFFDTRRFPKLAGVGNAFDRIQASIRLDTAHPAAWGGWHDAADADRSILPQSHTRAVHAMLDLYESNPAFFSTLDLNIPESGNNIPDLIDEASWCLDLFRRIQQTDGGVPSAIESIEHPSEPSHLTSLPTAITPPTPQTCHLYAAAAAQLSMALRPFDPQRARLFLDSALRAMKWAELNASIPNIYHRSAHLPQTLHANLAAAHLYRATGDQKWHEMFRRTLREMYPDGRIVIGRFTHGGPFGEAVYALMPAERVDADLQRQCRDALLTAADKSIEGMSKRPYRLDPNPANWDLRLGEPWPIMIAHQLRGDDKYIRALVDLASISAGLNPSNASYTRGLGARSMLTFNLDANYLGVPHPEGITTMGPLPRNTWGGDRTDALLSDTIHPAWHKWPLPESTFDVRYWTISEFTVGGVMATQLLQRGYLAQFYASSDR